MEAIPILLFIAPSWLVAVLYYWFSMRPHLESPKMIVLNQNLAKIGLYWSNCEGGFRELHEGAIEHDRHRAHRNFWILTTLLSLLSLLGTVLLVLSFLTGHLRLERNTFASLLVQDPELTPEQVCALVREIETTV